MKEPKRVPREGLNGHNDLQCLSKGPCQSPADASSTRIYLAPAISAEKAPIFIGAKHLLFNFRYPAVSMQWEDLFFLPRVASPGSSATDTEAVRCPAPLLAPVWGVHLVLPQPLRSGTSNASSSLLALDLPDECKLLKRSGDRCIPSTTAAASFSPTYCCCFSNAEFTQCPSEDKEQHCVSCCVSWVSLVYTLLTAAFPSVSLSQGWHYHGPTFSLKGGNISVVFALITQASAAAM